MKLFFCALVLALIFTFPASAVETSASAAAVINGDTGEIIYAQNVDKCLPMASTTKIMTALLLCEQGEPQREITVTADMLRVEGSSMGLLAGDRVTYHDLLYGMMLASGNDAANVTAIALGKTVDGFVRMMNDKAMSLGLKNTHFVTPSGLDAKEHYTTAKELALLAKYAMGNAEFAKAASSKTAVLNYGNPPYRRSLKNHNRLLKTFDGAVGVKTGFTKKSGRCLVSAARRDGKFVIAVTLHDPNDWEDHKKLLEYGLGEIEQTSFSPKTDKYVIPVIGSDKQSIEICIEPFIINTLELANVSCEVNLPHFIYAPVSSGEAVGNAVYRMNGEIIGEKKLVAGVFVDAKEKKSKPSTVLFENFKYIIRNIWEL